MNTTRRVKWTIVAREGKTECNSRQSCYALYEKRVPLPRTAVRATKMFNKSSSTAWGSSMPCQSRNKSRSMTWKWIPPMSGPRSHPRMKLLRIVCRRGSVWSAKSSWSRKERIGKEWAVRPGDQASSSVLQLWNRRHLVGKRKPALWYT